MALGIDDLIELAKETREQFLKHINGMTEEQMDFKPYAECKSVRETLQHLITDSRAAIHVLETGQMPDFAAIMETETDTGKLLAIIEESQNKVISSVKEKFGGVPLDTPIPFFGRPCPLWKAVLSMALEDNYHTGQAAFARMACDPAWDYYKAIYDMG